MARLMPGRTTVLVTHRGLALDLVDQVVVLEAGEVRWRGPRPDVPAEIVGSLLKEAG
jgi:ABC-type protease/lipase transport system fused ATPase/permease subunit